MENLLKKLLPLMILVAFLISAFSTVKFVDAAVNNRQITSLAYDGQTTSYNSNYGTCRNATTGSVSNTTITTSVGQLNYSETYYLYRSFLYFDTSVLPVEANITAAVLSLSIFQNMSATDFNVTIQNGQPIYPHTPLISSDHYYAYYSGSGGSRNTSEITALGRWNITLDATGISWIQTTGITKLCLKSNKDINYNAPSGAEFIAFYTAEKGSDSAPILYLTYETGEYIYQLQGAYSENGLRDGAINCTFYPSTESPVTFELDGTANVTAEEIPICFHFDIGYNESRIYYIYQSFEEIFVMKPSDPYSFYFFDIVDFIGLEWGYLESIVNLNGTDRVCERQTIDIINNIPFTFTWGRSYKMRLICNEGEYTYGSYVAGVTVDFTLAVTRDMFPVPPTDIGQLTVSATRKNMSWIQCIYLDAEGKTAWVNFAFYEYGNTTAFHSYNTTSNSVTYNWYEGAYDTDYLVIITIIHVVLGFKQWTYPCPAPSDGDGNPFAGLRLLGDFPFDLAQLPAVLLLICICLAFSWWNAPMGIIATTLSAFVFAWLQWLAVGWTWLITAGSIGFILALAMMKDRERG